MKALSSLPDGYREIDSVDLQRDKKTAILVNGLALLIAAAMVIPAALFVPFSTLFTQEDGLVAPLWKTLVLLVSLLAYMLLHELIHGIVMKALGTEKVKYGFTGMYAFAGSDDYYDKKGYIAIALAPVIFFLLVFIALCLLVPREWFWIAYLLQVCNVGGAAGDFFVVARFTRLPEDSLVRYSGTGMTVYAKHGKGNGPQSRV